MSRKDDHLQLSLDQRLLRNEKAWWDHVLVLHNALPEVDVDSVRLDTVYPCGARGFPIMVTGMTGGTPKAQALNEAIAVACQELGVPMGLGSIRPIFDGENQDGYDLRAVAPKARIYGNIGGTQVALYQKDGSLEQRLKNATESLQLDAMCVHLNPAQELLQPEGDRDFRGVLDAVVAVRELSPVPVVVKETGTGISATVVRSLLAHGIEWIDVSGSGGTSWTMIEELRSPLDMKIFNQWGIPTPVVARAAAEMGARTIASGGIRSGLDAAKALALGAQIAGLARPVLSAFDDNGAQGVLDALRALIWQTKVAATLMGASSLAQLQKAPVAFAGELKDWAELNAAQ